MTKARRVSVSWNRFEFPVSWNINPSQQTFLDCLNVISKDGVLRSRPGLRRLQGYRFGPGVNSISFFEKAQTGRRYIFAVVGTSLKMLEYGSEIVTTLLEDIPEGSRHEAEDYGDRHIIGIENKGLYIFDGDLFFRAGNQPPVPKAKYTVGAGNLSSAVFNLVYTFYSSKTGYESAPSDPIVFDFTLLMNKSIYIVQEGARVIGDLPSNSSIDKFRIYLKDVTNNSNYLFVEEFDLTAVAVDSLDPNNPLVTIENGVPGIFYQITDMPAGTETAPDDGGLPPQKDISCMAIFSDSIAVVTSEFPNEVQISEQQDPQHFRADLNGVTLYAHGPGKIIAIATGKFSPDQIVATEYLIIFKRHNIWLFETDGTTSKMVELSSSLGCVAKHTVSVKRNGDIYFMSESGWRVIREGRIVQEKTKAGTKYATIDLGKTSEMFTENGHQYELSKMNFHKFFSAYIETLDEYITWVVENGQQQTHGKAYCYEFVTGGFKPFNFPVNCKFAIEGSVGDDRGILIVDDVGQIYFYGEKNSLWDELANGEKTAIEQMATLFWVPKDGDHARSYNFRELLIRARQGNKPVYCKVFVNFQKWIDQDQAEPTYNFDLDYPPDAYFVLDQDVLDGVKGLAEGGYSYRTSRQDINRNGESIAIKLYQQEINASLGLISAQLEISGNGNRNLS